MTETCTNCQEIILDLRGVRAWGGFIVCVPCRKKLRKPAVVFPFQLIKAAEVVAYLGWTWAFICSGLAIYFYFKHGWQWLDENYSPQFETIAGYAIFYLLPISLLLLVSSRTRGWGGLGIMAYAYILGQNVWLLSLITCGALWGTVATIVGLSLLGLGVVGIAIIASLCKGYIAGGLLIMGLSALVLVCKYGGLGLVSKAAHDAAIKEEMVSRFKNTKERQC